MKIGLLGGSFDPVHHGHLKLAEAARRQLKLDKVYLVLTPRSPFKREIVPAPMAERLRLLRLAIRNKKFLRVGTWELKAKGVSYTIDTISAYKRAHPRDEIFFIMGSDSWTGFDRWRNSRKITRMARLVVGRRPGTDKIKVPRKYRNAVTVLSGRFPDISSTEIRNDKIMSLLQKSLSPGRFRHSLGVAELARELTERHGGDAALAYRTGLLHDCAKEWSPPKLKA